MNFIRHAKKNPILDLEKSIQYVKKRDCVNHSKYTHQKIENLDILLLQHYTESKIICIYYLDKKKKYCYRGMIERIDLIYKELYLLPKKKIAFCKIIGIESTIL